MGRKLIFGLDIGIGSVGWAVVSQVKNNAKIEDFGVRLFESGESNRGKDRSSQDRRRKRSSRRLSRRRSHRRARLKHLFFKSGLTNNNKIQAWYETNDPNLFCLRAKGINEPLSPEELAVSLIHISNHRGYRDFYDVDENTEDNAALEEAQRDIAGIQAVEEIFSKGGYRTIGEMFAKDKAFCDPENPKSPFPLVRNKEGRDFRYIIARKHHEREVALLLEQQAKHHSCLTPEVSVKIKEIIFSQRDFEDGPGDKNDPDRMYKGFLDSIGKCVFFKEESRGFRCTVLGDVYAVINVLSQYTYVNLETGEIDLPKAAAWALLKHFLVNAGIKVNDVKRILKEYNTEINIAPGAKKESLGQSVKYLKYVRDMLSSAGYDYNEWIQEEQFDVSNPSKLHLLGELMSKYQTPHRREKELGKLGFLNKKLIKSAHSRKFSGTSNVSYKYMVEAILAWLEGEAYGNFQARRNKEKFDVETINRTSCKTLPCLNDPDMIKNPVVFRSINETRKIVNALIGKYGSPASINVEVASELGRSYEGRMEILREQSKNEKEWEQLREELTELFKGKNIKITETLVERYKLYKLQKCQCLYSGKPLELEMLPSNAYEVDHIVPFSLILDNTLNNKALVLSSENQIKRQRVPLQYMSSQQAKEFKERVAVMLREKSISPKKFNYLTLANIDDDELLDEWKTRNINDTRYITKYITNFLQKNMLFDSDNGKTVYGVKGAVVSRFRRVWLNEKTWGAQEKDRKASQLHHAVDAIVVANLTPAYVEIASDNMKLHQMWRRNNRVENKEYKDYLCRCIKKMKRYHGFDEAYSEKLLRSGVVPSLVRRLRDEVDVRCIDDDENLFNTKVKEFYYNEPEFVSGLRMPLVSYKPCNKYKGEVSLANAISVKKIDDKNWVVKRVKVRSLKAKDLHKVVSGDADLMDTLRSIFLDKNDNYEVEDYLKERGMPVFVTNGGRTIYKVSVKSKELSDMPTTKNISTKNKTVLDTRKYYCLELYKDLNKKTCVRGIRFVDILKKQGKLFLQISNPEDYCHHVMYLFTNDYVEVYNRRDQLKFRGFYKSIKNINTAKLYGVQDNTPRSQNGDSLFSIAGGDTVRKYNVDLLGVKGGEIKCGAPLLLHRENG